MTYRKLCSEIWQLHKSAAQLKLEHIENRAEPNCPIEEGPSWLADAKTQAEFQGNFCRVRRVVGDLNKKCLDVIMRKCVGGTVQHPGGVNGGNAKIKMGAGEEETTHEMAQQPISRRLVVNSYRVR